MSKEDKINSKKKSQNEEYRVRDRIVEMHDQGMFDDFERGMTYILSVIEEDQDFGVQLYAIFDEGMKIDNDEGLINFLYSELTYTSRLRDRD